MVVGNLESGTSWLIGGQRGEGLDLDIAVIQLLVDLPEDDQIFQAGVAKPSAEYWDFPGTYYPVSPRL